MGRLGLGLLGEARGPSRPGSRAGVWEQGRKGHRSGSKARGRSRAEEELEMGQERAQCPGRGRDRAREHSAQGGGEENGSIVGAETT